MYGVLLYSSNCWEIPVYYSWKISYQYTFNIQHSAFNLYRYIVDDALPYFGWRLSSMNMLVTHQRFSATCRIVVKFNLEAHLINFVDQRYSTMLDNGSLLCFGSSQVHKHHLWYMSLSTLHEEHRYSQNEDKQLLLEWQQDHHKSFVATDKNGIFTINQKALQMIKGGKGRHCLVEEVFVFWDEQVAHGLTTPIGCTGWQQV